MNIETYLRHKTVFDESLIQVIEAGGTKNFDQREDYVQIAHLEHLKSLGFVEYVSGRVPTFRITDTGLAAANTAAELISIRDFRRSQQVGDESNAQGFSDSSIGLRTIRQLRNF